MERLPYEIQLEIFSQLPTEDRFTSLFVSKAWNMAAKTCVYNDVTIYHHEKLTSAMSYFEANVNLAHQVYNLEINDCKNIYQYLSQFQQLFANVDDFRVDLCEPQTSFDPKMTPTLGWKKLEYIETRETYNEGIPPILQLILSGHCPSLINVCTELNTTGNASEDTTMKHCAQIISLLKNAPQLTKLELGHLSCTINDLETLHQNTPNLRTLILSKDAEIIKTDTPIKSPDLNMLLAKCAENTLTEIDILETFIFLLHFEITFFSSIVNFQDVPHIYALFDFIGKNYCGLKFLSITCNTEYGGEEYLEYIYDTFEQDAIEERLLPLFTRCPSLFHYDQMFSPLSSAITHEMDVRNIQLKITALYLDVITMDDQLEALFGSQQPRYIEDLSIYQLDGIDYVMEWPTPRFACMINLKNLHLEGKNSKICFTQLAEFLMHCPQLEKFGFYDTMLHSTEVDTNLPELALRSLSILRLYIQSMTKLQVAETILKNVLSHSPKLERIYLSLKIGDRCIQEDETKPFTFTLDFRTNTKLKKIDIHIDVNIDDYKPRYYIESPKMTGYYYSSFESGDNRLMQTTPFPPGEYYTTILLSRPVDLNRIIIE